MSLDVFPMYLHCIRSLRFFESCCFILTQTGISCLHLLHVMGCFSYVFALYTFVTFFLIVAVFFSHKQASLVYNRYMSWDGFPMILHCIRSLHFLKDVSDLCIFLFSSAV